MRIRGLFLFAWLFLTCPAFAQTITTIGMRGGFGQAAHHRCFEKDYGGYYVRPVLAKAIGINLTLGFSTQLALESGLDYEEKGNFPYGLKNKYTYLSWPVTLKWNPLGQRRIAPYMRGGAYYAHLITHKQILLDLPISDVSGPEYYPPRTRDLGLVAGIGADWQLSPHLQLNMDLSSTRGLLNLYEGDPSSLILTYPLYNVSWILATGLRYML